MINLLPPAVKSEGTYAKRNTMLIRYIWLLVVVILVVGAEFGATEVYLAHQRQSYAKTIATKQQAVAGYKNLQDQAAAANGRLKAFKVLVSQQARFSALLADLAAHTPKDVFINSISLTGNAAQAVQISGTANSYAAAASLRDALASSPRIQAAAINDISNPSAGVYNVNVTIAFAPGAFK